MLKIGQLLEYRYGMAIGIFEGKKEGYLKVRFISVEDQCHYRYNYVTEDSMYSSWRILN